MSVSATFMPVIGTRAETVKTTKAVETTGAGKDKEEIKSKYPENLTQTPCIQYPITFRKKSVPVSALFDSGSKINAIHPTFARELGLPIRPTDVGAQKIDGTTLDSFGMVVAAFLVTDTANRVIFFEETFLVANVSLKIVFGMLFLTLSDAYVDFLSWELRLRTYTTKKALPTTRHVGLVGKKEFVAAALDSEHETYVVYIGSVNSNALLSSSPLDVHPFRRPQISGLIAEKAPIKGPAKYLDFADISSLNLASELPELTDINNHTIELVND